MHSQHRMTQQAIGWHHKGPWRCSNMQWAVGWQGCEGCEHHGGCCNCWVHDSLGMGSLGHRPAGQGLEDSSSHLSSPPPARAHDWHRVFSHGAFLGRAVCRRHLQATGPSVFPVVPSSACFGDVQFRWATERLPIVGCHMCRRQFVGTARLGTEVPFYYIRLVVRASALLH